MSFQETHKEPHKEARKEARKKVRQEARARDRRSLRRVCLVAAAMPLAASAAIAADLPVPNMPTKAPPAPVYQWTGCYVGLNGGGGASASKFTTAVDPGTHLVDADAAEVTNDGTGSANGTNALGGGQAGCNWQTGTLVFGLEGDFDYFRSKAQFFNDANTLPVAGAPFVIGQTLETNYLATLRPRFGVAADRNFAYLTGGVAFTRATYTESYLDGAAPAGAGVATAAKSLTGWTAGAGWEYAWAEHWTVRFEYLFAKFGTVHASGTITDAAAGANGFHGSADLAMHVVRAGVNFKY